MSVIRKSEWLKMVRSLHVNETSSSALSRSVFRRITDFLQKLYHYYQVLLRENLIQNKKSTLDLRFSAGNLSAQEVLFQILHP